MKYLSLLLILVVTGVGIFVSSCKDTTKSPQTPSTPTTQLRFIHLVKDAPELTLKRGGTEIARLSSLGSTQYSVVTAGKDTLELYQANKITPIFYANPLLELGKNYAIYAIPDNGSRGNEIKFIVCEEPQNTLTATLTLVHAAKDFPAVRLKLNGRDSSNTYSSNPVVFENSFTFKDLRNAMNYSPVLLSTDRQPRIFATFKNLSLNPANAYTFAIYNSRQTPQTPEYKLFSSDGGQPPLDVQMDSSRINYVHVSPDAGMLDISRDGFQESSLEYSLASDYRLTPAGFRDLKFGNNQMPGLLKISNFNSEKNRNYTVFIADSIKRIRALPVIDNLNAPQLQKAHIRFIHLSSDPKLSQITVKLKFNQQDVPIGNYQFGNLKNGNFMPVDVGTSGPRNYMVSYVLAGQTQYTDLGNINLFDQGIYSILAYQEGGGQTMIKLLEHKPKK